VCVCVGSEADLLLGDSLHTDHNVYGKSAASVSPKSRIKIGLTFPLCLFCPFFFSPHLFFLSFIFFSYTIFPRFSLSLSPFSSFLSMLSFFPLPSTLFLSGDPHPAMGSAVGDCSAVSSPPPSGSGQSLAAKRFVVHFGLKQQFW